MDFSSEGWRPNPFQLNPLPSQLNTLTDHPSSPRLHVLGEGVDPTWHNSARNAVSFHLILFFTTPTFILLGPPPHPFYLQEAGDVVSGAGPRLGNAPIAMGLLEIGSTPSPTLGGGRGGG